MRVLIIAAIYVFIVVNGLNENVVEGKQKDDRTPDVVTIKENGKRICGGVQIIDLKILSAAICAPNFQPEKSNLTVSFKKDDQSYTVKNVDFDGDLAILILDGSQNPPKSESKIEWANSNTYKKMDKGTVKVFQTAKKQGLRKGVNVKISEHCQEIANNAAGKICAVPNTKKTLLCNTDVGSPLLFDDVVGGILLTADRSSTTAKIVEKTYDHKEFIEKHLENDSKKKKENKPPTYKKPRKRVPEPDYPERQPQVVNDLPDFDVYPRSPDTADENSKNSNLNEETYSHEGSIDKHLKNDGDKGNELPPIYVDPTQNRISERDPPENQPHVIHTGFSAYNLYDQPHKKHHKPKVELIWK